MLLTLLLACDPLAAQRDAERAWERDAALVPVPAGEPVPPWPRVTLGPEGVGLDNHRWLLSQPEAAERGTAAAVAPMATHQPSLAPLRDDGRFASDTLLVKPLQEALTEQWELTRLATEPPRGVVLAVAPGVDASALQPTLYSIGQSALGGTWQLVGRGPAGPVGVLAGRQAPSACAAGVVMSFGAEGLTLNTPGTPLPLRVGGGCRLSTTPDGTGALPGLDAAMRAVHAACGPRWQADGVAEVDRCVSVITALPDAPGVDAGAVMSALSTVYAAWPLAEQGWLVGLGDPPRPCAEAVELAPLDPAVEDRLCAAPPRLGRPAEPLDAEAIEELQQLLNEAINDRPPIDLEVPGVDPAQ